MFSIDTETGFPHVVVINAAWGSGRICRARDRHPDQYLVFKPLLADQMLRADHRKDHWGTKRKSSCIAEVGEATTKNIQTPRAERHAFVLQDEEILQLARWACAIEKHYGAPMDIEWAKDGDSGELFIVQARPETVHSQRAAGVLKTYRLIGKGERLLDRPQHRRCHRRR